MGDATAPCKAWRRFMLHYRSVSTSMWPDREYGNRKAGVARNQNNGPRSKSILSILAAHGAENGTLALLLLIL